MPEETAALFAELLEKLVDIVGQAAIESLDCIVVVDPGDVADTANRLISATGDLGRYASSPTHPARAVTLPLESAGEFRCVIVLARTFLEPLGPTFRRPWDTVSTTLEELLHAWSFDAAFRRRGYVQHRTRDMSACDLDLLTISSQVCDEYVVIRKKAQILSSTPLVQAEPGGDVVVCQVRYPGSLVSQVAAGSEQLESLVRNGREVSVLPADYWPSLVGVLWRGIFEPLSRHAAYVDAENQKPSDESQLHLQPFYRAVLGRHWTTTRGALRRSFESDLLATDEVTVEILEVMRALLEEVGVTYRKMPGGECWIEVR